MHPCWAGVADGSAFYFAHSYYAVPSQNGLIAATTNYPDPVCAAAARNQHFAVQFHPERAQTLVCVFSEFLNLERNGLRSTALFANH